MKIIALILIIFILSTLLIISNDNLTMRNSENAKKFFSSYNKQIKNFYLNLKISLDKILREISQKEDLKT